MPNASAAVWKAAYNFVTCAEEEEFPTTCKEIETLTIKESLERHNGNRKAAADELGISERTIYRKIKKL